MGFTPKTLTSGAVRDAAVVMATVADPRARRIRAPMIRGMRMAAAFVEIVRNCRDSIASVHCPILFLHGDADEVIPLKSSIHAYEKVTHPDKRLIILHEGRHHLLSEPISANECYQLILLFFKGEIVTRRRTFAPDILNTLQHPQAKEPPASEKER